MSVGLCTRAVSEAPSLPFNDLLAAMGRVKGYKISRVWIFTTAHTNSDQGPFTEIQGLLKKDVQIILSTRPPSAKHVLPHRGVQACSEEWVRHLPWRTQIPLAQLPSKKFSEMSALLWKANVPLEAGLQYHNSFYFFTKWKKARNTCKRTVQWQLCLKCVVKRKDKKEM